MLQRIDEPDFEINMEGKDGSLNCEFAHLEPSGESLRIR